MEKLELQKRAEILTTTIIYPALSNFPKSERFCICQEIKQACYRIIKNCMRYQTSQKKYRCNYLDRIDDDLKLLLVLIGISRDLEYIKTINKAAYIQSRIAELGRMTGGLKAREEGYR